METTLKHEYILPILAVSLISLAAAAPATEPAPLSAAAPETDVETNAFSPEAIAAGKSAFKRHCQACHTAEEGGRSVVGPNLHGVLGRAAGAGEFRYSAALKNSGITWDREQLDGYIKSPMKHVPGTRMFMGLADDEGRDAVIDFLSSTAQ